MEPPAFHNLFDRRPITKSKAPATKWFKEWVPQDVVATGGKCFLLKWVNEATLKALKEKPEEPEVPEPEPKPATDVLFLCSYEGCGKTFIDAGALRKHSHIHGERQYICHYENCGKKFLDSSKLKRHFLIHTGERNYMCPHEGCGKAFSLDFNLKSHMKTHSQENYHVCPYPECGKRYAHEYKLKNHVASAHQKTAMPDATKYSQPVEKPNKTAKSSGAVHASASSNRPYICPYEGCDKAYIHEYKLNLHLRKEHPRHFPDESAKNAQPAATENEMDEDVAQDTYPVKRKNTKTQKQSRPKPNLKPPPAKARRQNAIDSPANLSAVNKPWPVKEEAYEEDEDSEETEEEKFNVGDQWRYRENGDDEDEDTELED
ncbi:zinc finger transcription factor YY1-like [Ipomoea triloba]|uniref:zinc finger transcription factor YY1-like n=1 Tax=Ipomoea triloba TaxID=35885 RepID=UPI00125D23C2|nr:zinc finger transcription factor YY1-like [Ipomoea triloba]